jgi:hypothetical protein
MDVKFALRLGANVVEFEGASDLFDQKISPIIERLLDGTYHTSSPPANPEVASAKVNANVPPMTTKSIATKLGASGGTTLLYAAVASLAIVKGKDTFNRQDLIAEMKSAVGFYRPTYLSNLSSYIETLLKQGVIIEVAKDTFALKESERVSMEQKLA